MPFKFPYTNFQELNLDWIIKKVKDLSKQIEDDSSIVSEYIDRLIAVEDKADNAEATATAADARATGANNTANSALTLATQAKQTAEIADLSTTLLGLKIGDLSSLYTTAKDTIVNAINEVWSIFHNATAVTNVTPAGTDPAVTYSNGVFTFDLPEGGDPDAVTHAELDAAIDDVEDTIDALTDRVDGLEDDIDDLSEALDDKADVIIDTVSGDIASFPDGTATPLKSLIVNVEPVQAGSGDPSPSNVRPISGRNGLTVYDTSHNVWDEEWELGYLNPTTGGNAGSNNCIRSKNYIAVLPNTDYYCYVPSVTGVNLKMYYYADDKSFISWATKARQTLTTPPNTRFIRFYMADAYGTTYNNDISINYPSTDTEYHAYTGDSYHVNFNETVFGAKPDLISGEMPVTMDEVHLSDFNWQIGFSGFYSPNFASISKRFTVNEMPTFLCDMLKTTTYADASTSEGSISQIYGGSGYAYNGYLLVHDTTCASVSDMLAKYGTAQLVYELANPTEATITPVPVNSLKGYNNIWSDAGAVEVIYRADTKGYIDKLIAQVQALALGG